MTTDRHAQIPTAHSHIHEEADVVDLFGGPGGWDVALTRLLGSTLNVVGIEWDQAACATRRAAGLATIEDDVRAWTPQNFPQATGFIASPSCQSFSMAGSGSGRRSLDEVLSLIDTLAADHQRVDINRFPDPRTGLVLEPLWWILTAADAGHPYRWIALEQVPSVLPVWQAYARVLAAHGYQVAVGKVHAEQHGVPQTRTRAVLLAHRERPVALPAPTHSKFYPRTPSKLDPDVAPWVSMADALGWGASRRPGMTVTCGGTGTGGAEPFGNGARQGLHRELEAGRWVVRSNYGTGGDCANRGERKADQPAAARRNADEPAPTVHFGGRVNDVRFVMDDHPPVAQVRNSGPGAARDPRPIEEPSYTIRSRGSGSHPSGVEWFLVGTNVTADGTYRTRSTTAPAMTVTSQARSFRLSHSSTVPVSEPGVKGGNMALHGTSQDRMETAHGWPASRPSTPIQGDPRLAAPGRRDRAAGERQFDARTIKVTVQEAAVLQTFPDDYPWSGSKSKQYEQVGNAVPPVLAAALLREVLR